MRTAALAGVALALGLSYTVATAGPIVQDFENAATQILWVSPLGQTFTAEDPRVSIGFWIFDVNRLQNPDDRDLTITLYEGVGTGGTVLGSGDITGLADDFAGFADVDFSFVDLVVGEVYTAIISNDTTRWAMSYAEGDDYAATGNQYDGGDLIIVGALRTDADARFRVLPVATAIPEPASVALLGLGLVGLASLRTRSRRPA